MEESWRKDVGKMEIGWMRDRGIKTVLQVLNDSQT